MRSLIDEGYSVKSTWEILNDEGLFTHGFESFRKCYYKAKNRGELKQETAAPRAHPPASLPNPFSAALKTDDISDLDPTDRTDQEKLAEAAFRAARRR